MGSGTCAGKNGNNGNEAGKDQVNIDTLKAGEDTIAKQLDKL